MCWHSFKDCLDEKGTTCGCSGNDCACPTCQHYSQSCLLFCAHSSFSEHSWKPSNLSKALLCKSFKIVRPLPKNSFNSHSFYTAPQDLKSHSVLHSSNVSKQSLSLRRSSCEAWGSRLRNLTCLLWTLILWGSGQSPRLLLLSKDHRWKQQSSNGCNILRHERPRLDPQQEEAVLDLLSKGQVFSWDT